MIIYKVTNRLVIVIKIADCHFGNRLGNRLVIFTRQQTDDYLQGNRLGIVLKVADCY